MPEAAPDRKGLSRLRGLLLNPGNVYLRSVADRVWLTDKFVIVDVTGFSVVQGLDEGWYRIVASGPNAGLREPDKKNSEENEKATWHLNIANWLKEIRSRDYCPVIPTGLSFTNDEGKAFLLIADIRPYVRYRAHSLIPVAMNEDIWHGFSSAWPEASLSHPGYTGPFRISTPENEELAYVEGTRILDELQKIAMAVVDVYLEKDGE